MSFARHHLLISNYTTENMGSHAIGPSQAVFMDKGALPILSRKETLLTEIETLLRGMHTKYLEYLENSSGSSLQARLDVAVLADLIIRCLLP